MFYLGERAFSLYDIEAFIREAGAEKVTEDAVLNLERELEKLAESVANRAAKYAAHAGRHRLIKKNDVLLAKPVSNYTNYRKPYILSKKAITTNIASSAER